MSDPVTIWIVGFTIIGLAVTVVWLVGGEGMRRWFQRSWYCPRGRHLWVWSAEQQVTALRRFCRSCGAEDMKYAVRQAISDQETPRAILVGVRGRWGDPAGYES
ncbi:MAG: hypothetical protein Q8Q52_05405 [Acidimicrobiia bacterium]|nr:hypothetical protein [Acidimicrobiia bacterium]